MDPASVAIAVRTCAVIASAIMRGLTTWFDSKPIDPWKYYRLGGLVERWRQGWTAGAPSKERGAAWREGVYLSPSGGDVAGKEKYILDGKGAYDVNFWASRLLSGKKGDRKLSGLDFHAMLSGLKGGDYSETNAHWTWIMLGRAEYRDRYIPSARNILKSDPDNFFAELDKATTTAGSTGAAWREAGSQQGTDLHQVALSAQARYRELTEAQKKLLPVWRKISPPAMLNSKIAADNELKRWVLARAVAVGEAVSNARWYGPPVPWALNVACRLYGRDGPSALVRYLSVNGQVTADVRSIAARVCPAALADPSLKNYWSRTW